MRVLSLKTKALSHTDWFLPKLAKGEPIHSVGISQVRFNENGKVVFHQDFWDSGRHIYGQIPVVGGMIGIIKDRMK